MKLRPFVQRGRSRGEAGDAGGGCASVSKAPSLRAGHDDLSITGDENGIGDAGVDALVRSLSGGGGGGGGGALPSLMTLSLDNNRIRLEGARRLVEGLRSGALPQCTNLLLNDNPAGRRAQDEVNEVLKRRSTS